MSARPTTVATLSTAPGRGGIAVILLAGPEANRITRDIFRPIQPHAAAADEALQLGRILDDGRILDEAIVCRCRTHVEINIHGGPVVAAAVLKLLARCGADVRPPGEGTPTGLNPAHPKWDNPAVGREMLAALAQAASERVVAAIANQWSGGLSRLARESLTSPAASPETAAALHQAAEGLALQRRLLTPAQVVIAGPPNVGKSTLANALAARPISIVHDLAGTTRDWVQEPARISGVPINLTDTAGLWQPADEVDAEAVARARQRARQADLVLLVSAESPVARPPWLRGKDILRVAAKCDAHAARYPADVRVSAHTHQGLKELRGTILAALGLADLDVAAPMAFTERQADLLHRAAGACERDCAQDACEALRALLEGPAAKR